MIGQSVPVLSCDRRAFCQCIAAGKLCSDLSNQFIKLFLGAFKAVKAARCEHYLEFWFGVGIVGHDSVLSQ